MLRSISDGIRKISIPLIGYLKEEIGEWRAGIIWGDNGCDFFLNDKGKPRKPGDTKYSPKMGKLKKQMSRRTSETAK